MKPTEREHFYVNHKPISPEEKLATWPKTILANQTRVPPKTGDISNLADIPHMRHHLILIASNR